MIKLLILSICLCAIAVTLYIYVRNFYLSQLNYYLELKKIDDRYIEQWEKEREAYRRECSKILSEIKEDDVETLERYQKIASNALGMYDELINKVKTSPEYIKACRIQERRSNK